MQTITGLEAAQMEKDGKGAFSLAGKTVTFTGSDGRSVAWTLGSAKEADIQLRFFRRSAL